MKVTNAVIKGFAVKIYKRKIKIFDPYDKLSDEEALGIVQYLYSEGFLLDSVSVECEIVVF